MNQTQILDVVRETIIVVLKLAGPSMVLALREHGITDHLDGHGVLLARH